MKSVLNFLIIFLIIMSINFAEEGMYPLSEIDKLDLDQLGFEIAGWELYNPDGISLIDGICKVGGCSGSFVSSQGLILTNHHCAYEAIRDASTPLNDFLENGFHAATRDQEVRAEGYQVRITVDYYDVSESVISVITAGMDPADRTEAIKNQIKSIELQAEEDHPGLRAEVAEMFIGRTYVMFFYKYLKDVRLVYAPPRSIGNFGGEVDNWMWPRHTGDFSLMRVYVAPDGRSADYSEDNIPYIPERVIEIDPNGVDENDFVFILGYPGRTYRNRTSHHLAFEYDLRLPITADLYQWQISVLKGFGINDRDISLKLASRIKSLSNRMKNYRGKLQGIRRIGLVEQRLRKEQELQEYIGSNPDRKERYGNILEAIGTVYSEKRERYDYEFVLSNFKASSVLFKTAYTVYEMAHELPKADLERKKVYMNRNLDKTIENLFERLKNYHGPADEALFQDMLERYNDLPIEFRIPVLDSRLGKNITVRKINRFVAKALRKSRLGDPENVRQLLSLNSAELESLKDPILQLAIDLYPEYENQRRTSEARSGEIDRLHNLLMEIKIDFLDTDFIPDANSTLRLTYGHIRGYSPVDATYYSPISTLTGAIEKIGPPPFDLPEKIVDLHRRGEFGRYCHPKLNSVPVGLLYNMDTTGGNSGSAVMNSQGKLVGINFDRAYEATINDYAWNEAYSRSIAVDIRYVLWIMKYFSNANELIDEMGL